MPMAVMALATWESRIIVSRDTLYTSESRPAQRGWCVRRGGPDLQRVHAQTAAIAAGGRA